MLVNEKLIFLQLQKTGGTHIESLLFDLFPETKQLGKHYRIPTDFSVGSRLITGAVRDPWQWYLSYWSYSCLSKGGPFNRCVAPKSFSNVFRNKRMKNSYNYTPRNFSKLLKHAKCEIQRPARRWAYLYEDSNDPQRFREWLKLVFCNERKYDLFQDYGFSAISNFAGVYTYLFLFLFSKHYPKLFDKRLTASTLKSLELNVDFFLRSENLSEDFKSLMSQSQIHLSDKLLAKINAKTNVSERAHTTNYYYDKESVELVRKKDAFIIHKFNYEFKNGTS